MSDEHSFTIRSRLSATPETVWAHASSFAGVNRELWPWARMTYPPRFARLTSDVVPLNVTAFRSWILLFGVLPVDYDDITLIELTPSCGFHESSSMGMMRVWRHRRTLTAAASGCVLQDDVSYVPRWNMPISVLSRVYRFMFAQRHRALRRIFGGSAAN